MYSSRGGNPSLPPDRDLFDGLSPVSLGSIKKPENAVEEATDIGDFRLIGSYSWTDAPKPTIIVPGSPRIWTDRSTPYQVQPDVGTCFVDQNGFRMPSTVLLPLITAVNLKTETEGGPPFDWSSVQFVTDRNGLRKLLRWIEGGTVKDFRIDTQLAGDGTILMNRWEKRTRETSSGYTYGFNFEHASTTPADGCSKSTGYHRIVQYIFGGMKMVVRFEVDAAMPPSAPPRTSAKSTSDVDDLANLFGSTRISPASAKSTTKTKSLAGSPELIVQKGGSYIVQSDIMELTTRSVNNYARYDWKDPYPQLFLSQTPYHVLGVHQRGRFVSVQMRTLDSPELVEAAESAQESLRKLRQALETIQTLVKKHGREGRISLVCNDGTLEIYERSTRAACLPENILELFDSQNNTPT